MNQVSIIFSAIMPVILITSAGFFFKKRGVVDAQTQSNMMRVTVWLLFPCLVLDRVPHNVALNTGNLAWMTPLAGFLSIAIGLLIAWIMAPVFNVREKISRRTFVYGAAIFNYGYIAIPLCQTLIGRDAVAVLLLFNAGIELAIWTIGFAVLTGHFSRDAWKKIINPMTLGTLFALGLNRSGFAEMMPDWLCSTFTMLGGCAIPLGILLVGMSLPTLLAGFSWKSDFAANLGAVVLRNGVIPLAMIAPVLFFALPKPLGAILALQAAMPAGMFPIVVAQHFGGDGKMALRVTIISSLFAFVTLPLWLAALAGIITP